MATIQDLESLTSALSPQATVDIKGSAAYAASAARWSDLNTPKPGAVINVASEADVEATVRWATGRGVPFVAQSGGHGWSSWYRVGGDGIVINMRALNSVVVDVENGTAVLGGGVTVKEAATAAKAAKAHLTIGTCNSVGAIPAMLGGGTGYMIGKHGLGADNIISARLVTAAGEAVTASESSHPELFWALRGAGHNFGIVTSITVRCFPERNGGEHYMGLVAFPDAMLEAVVATLGQLKLEDDSSLDLLFTRAPPEFNPVVALSLFHSGSVESAHERFRDLFALGGFVVQEGMVPYDRLNDALDFLCVRGGNKPTFSISFDDISAAGLRAFWPEFVAFSGEPTAGMTTMNLQLYHTDKARSVALDATAVGPALRTRKVHGFIAAVYADAALDGKARTLGDSFRAKMGDVEGGRENLVYANFAVGDESVEALYGKGGNLDRLKKLKAEWDPNGIFNHFIPIA